MGVKIEPRLELFKNILECFGREPVEIYLDAYDHHIRIAFKHTGWNQIINADLLFNSHVQLEEIADKIVRTKNDQEASRRSKGLRDAYNSPMTPQIFAGEIAKSWGEVTTSEIKIRKPPSITVNKNFRQELQQQLNDWLGVK